ncbi:MAG: hypothetical protein JWM33_2135 [Caulobacteraceae bacterium]|nr:hypothetical protein [Caulobacteraceae bacterium]
MPRNGSGAYTPPSNSFNPAVANTTIDPAAWAQILSDLAAAITTSIARDGQTATSQRIPFAAGVGINDGAAALPALAFTGSPTTGLYASGADELAVAIGGARQVKVSGDGVELAQPLPIASGGTGAANAGAARASLGLAVGTDVQAHDADLDAVAGLSSAGLVARTGAGAAAARTLTGTSGEVTVANGDGAAGNPTVSLPASLNFTGKTVTGGAYAGPSFTGTDSGSTLSRTSGTVAGPLAVTLPAVNVANGLQVGLNTAKTAGNTVQLLGNTADGGLSQVFTNHVSTEGPLAIGTWTHRADQIYLQTSGRVGIGTVTDDGSSMLLVNGSVRSLGSIVSAENASSVQLVLTSTGNGAAASFDKFGQSYDAGFYVKQSGSIRWICGEMGSSGANTGEFLISRYGVGVKGIKIDPTSYLVTLTNDVAVGGAIYSAGGQIQFPATQNPSSEPNTLDDYEEGAWTPGITFASGGATGVGYVSRFGNYVKIGRLVTVQFYINLSSKGSSTGTLQITGLPFGLVNTSYHGSIGCRNVNFTTGSWIRLAANACDVYKDNSNSAAEADLNNNAELQGSITYLASA